MLLRVVDPGFYDTLVTHIDWNRFGDKFSSKTKTRQKNQGITWLTSWPWKRWEMKLAVGSCVCVSRMCTMPGYWTPNSDCTLSNNSLQTHWCLILHVNVVQLCSLFGSVRERVSNFKIQAGRKITCILEMDTAGFTTGDILLDTANFTTSSILKLELELETLLRTEPYRIHV